MNGTGWIERVIIAANRTKTYFIMLIQRWLVTPFKKYIFPLGTWAWHIIRTIGRIIRPTLFRAHRANKKIAEIPRLDTDQEATEWQEKLHDCTYEQREYAVNTLVSLFESDQNRIRGVESKARGVIQTAGLVFAIVFAGDAVALNLALREESLRSALVFVLVAASGVYLLAALVASLYVEKPRQHHVLDPDDVLPPELAGSKLAIATKLNRSGSITRTNLAESAIFDAARALVTAALALFTALFTI